jgi:hypothetical protein
MLTENSAVPIPSSMTVFFFSHEYIDVIARRMRPKRKDLRRVFILSGLIRGV